jgi:hypothetical protein
MLKIGRGLMNDGARKRGKRGGAAFLAIPEAGNKKKVI